MKAQDRHQALKDPDYRFSRLRKVHSQLANLIPYAWADDPDVECPEMRGLCDALCGIEMALGIKYELSAPRINQTTGQWTQRLNS